MKIILNEKDVMMKATSIADNQPTYKGAVNNKYLYLLMLCLLAIGVLCGFWIKQFQDIERDTFLSNDYYYELPNGGYIYIDSESIRYNEQDFNGKLDYQNTLNYTSVK